VTNTLSYHETELVTAVKKIYCTYPMCQCYNQVDVLFLMQNAYLHEQRTIMIIQRCYYFKRAKFLPSPKIITLVLSLVKKHKGNLNP
jgi:hypothetical protein